MNKSEANTRHNKQTPDNGSGETVMCSKTRMVVLGLLCMVLAACGGGGGGSDPTPPTPPPPPPSAPAPNSFLPTDTSLRLTYTVLNAAAQFEATTQRNDQFVAPYRYPNGYKDYYVSTPDSVSLAGFFSPQVQISGAGTFTADARFNTPVTLFRNDWTTQQTASVSGNGTVTITPTYGNQSLTYSGTAMFIGTQDVVTPLGTFSARRVHLDLNVSTTIQGSTFTVPFNVDLWFARNIGIVQRAEAGTVIKLSQATGPDADGDGVFDGLDALPNNPSETRDTDGDGTGNNADTDDDNDSVADAADEFPLDPTESADFDNDGTGDNADIDDDNDGVPDVIDPFPFDIHNTDTDQDGIADFYDTDDDNDTFDDEHDRFPLDASEWADNDNDGLGDNTDNDDDNDGRSDLNDAYPLNPNRWEALDVDAEMLTLAAVFGSAGGPDTAFNVTGENVTWEAESSAPWVQLNTLGGTGPTHIIVSTNIQGLAVGTHTARLTLTDPETARSVGVDVELTLSLPQLSVSVPSVSFDGKYGWDVLTQPIDVSLNTGLTAYPVSFAVTFDAAGAISTTFTGGIVDAAPRRLNVNLDPAKLNGGRHAGQLTVTASVLGQTMTRTLPLEALASTRVLYPSSDAVALAQISIFPSLTRTIQVLDSYGLSGTQWTAAGSGEPWLQSVTPSGVSGGDLTITVDPAGLPEGLHRASVTLASADANIDTTVPIQVSLYVKATPGGNVLVTQAGVYKQLAADPLRPHLYAHNGSGTIDVHHMHTHAQLPSITGLSGSLGAMAPSSDGKWLFVQDSVDGSVTRIDLDDTTVHVTWPLTEQSNTLPKNAIAYARPNGHPVLVLSDRRFVDANTGAVLGVVDLPFLMSLDMMATSLDGKRVCAVNSQSTPFAGDCFVARYGDYDNSPSVVTGATSHLSGHDVPGGGFASDVAITADGESAVVATDESAYAEWGFSLPPSGHGGPLLPFDTFNQAARGIATAPDGAIYMNVVTFSDGIERMYAWNDNGASLRLSNFPVGSTSTIVGLKQQLVITGDGMGAAYLMGSAPTPDVSTELHFLRAY